MEVRLRPTICSTSLRLSNRFMRTLLAGNRVEVPGPAVGKHALELRSLRGPDWTGHPGIPRKGSVPAYGVGLHSPICSEVEVLSSLSLPLPEPRAQVAARFAFACLAVPLGHSAAPGRSQPLPSPSPLVAFAAARSIKRLPLLGGEARRRSCPRPGRRCAASCWIVVSSIAPCRRLIPLGRSFLRKRCRKC